MKTIRPRTKEERRIIDSISKERVVYSDDIHFNRLFKRNHPNLFDDKKGYMDLSRNDKRKTSVFTLRKGVNLFPVSDFDSDAMKMKFSKYMFSRRL